MADSKSVSRFIQDKLFHLCTITAPRPVGSKCNQEAGEYIETILLQSSFNVSRQTFNCLDWISEGAELVIDGLSFEVQPSPYSLGCEISAELIVVSTVEELENSNIEGKLLLLMGDIASEQLMPKNFVFYNPEHHKKIYGLLEKKNPAALITATAKNPETAGSMYPFPLFEDGDFNIPSVYMKDIEGEKLASCSDKIITLKSSAQRIPSTGFNISAERGSGEKGKILFLGHYDAKENTPGALDNGTGTAVLLALGELLKNYDGDLGLEILPVNGEDYYSAAGQMKYLELNEGKISDIVCAVNIDAPGYIKGETHYSFYECPETIQRTAHRTLGNRPGIHEGEQWFQSDHMIFAQNKRPAMAISSEHMAMICSEIAHTPHDNLELVDYDKLAELALGLRDMFLGIAEKH
ncbi:MAG: M28 family peptidase [Chitinivibrionales bacterium]|nr:M28 family peptidase [Chitinivibrionales bacterium]